MSIGNLRSKILEDSTLPEALAKIGNKLTHGTSLQFVVEVVGNYRGLPIQMENNLLRIGQEAITNAVKHSKASLVTLGVSYTSTDILLVVNDNGCGTTSNVESKHESPKFGMIGMAERVERMNGTISINSMSIASTCIDSTSSVGITIRLIALGRSNKEIAKELCISEDTVKTHLRAVYQKLGVNHRTQAVTAALRNGLVRLDSSSG